MPVRLACLCLFVACVVGVGLPCRALAQDPGSDGFEAPLSPVAEPAAPDEIDPWPPVAPAPNQVPLAPAPEAPPPPAFAEPEFPPPAEPLPPFVSPDTPIAPVYAPPSPQIARGPFEIDPLSCPECACERARTDTVLLRREYRSTSRTVSTRGPRLMMVAGFIGAGVFSIITSLAYTQPFSTDYEEIEDHARRRRVLAEGVVAISIPLALGLFGMHWYGERRREAAPYMQRFRELRFALREAKLTQRDVCRGVARR
jgi:hypothetical protein